MMIKRIQARFPLHYQQNIFRICLTQVFPRANAVVTRSNFHSFNVEPSKTISHFYSFYRIAMNSINFVLRRDYSKKRKTNHDGNDEKSDSDEDDDDLVDKLDKSSKVIRTNVTSMRLDAVVKSGLALSRNKIDNLFYEGRLRLNGSKITKKSQRLNVGDVVDVIKGVDPKNDDMLNVSRIEVLSAAADEEEDAIRVKIRRIKQLSIENYKEHPWVEVTE